MNKILQNKTNTIPSVFLLSLIGLFLLLIGCAPTVPQGNANKQEPSPAQPATRPAFPWASSGVKIAYVRTDIIMQRYPDYQDAERNLREENRRWLGEAEKMEQELRRMETEREELALILSDERRKQLDDEITKSRQALQKFRHETWYAESSTYIKRRRELMDPVDARVNDAIWKVAEAQNVDIVFDTVAGNILYVKPGMDLTDQVLEELQK